MRLTRRALLAGSAAAIMPAIASPVAQAVVAPVTEPLPMWAVGTLDNFDWIAVAAPTEDAAKRLWSAGYCDPCDSAEPDCECDACYSFRGIEAERKPEWDGKDKLTRADWLRADMLVPCDRCGEHCAMLEDAQPVGDRAVCLECMTLDDWDVVNPVRAAELREELEDA